MHLCTPDCAVVRCAPRRAPTILGPRTRYRGRGPLQPEAFVVVIIIEHRLKCIKITLLRRFIILPLAHKPLLVRRRLEHPQRRVGYTHLHTTQHVC